MSPEPSSRRLPVGWDIVPAHEACEKIQDGTHFSPKVQMPDGPYRYLTAKNIRPRGLDLGDVTYLRESDHRAIYSRCDTRKGDVLLVKDGVNAGDAALNTLDDEVSLLSSVCFLRPRLFLTGAFLRYYLLSPLGAKSLTDKLTGTAIRRIVLQRVRALPVVIAPLQEQQRLVEALDSYISRLDDAEVALERVQRNLKRYRAAVLQVAVEGRLVPTEAELARAEGRDYEPASELLKCVLAERRRRWEEAALARLKAAGNAPKDDKWKARYEEPAGPDPNGLPRLPEAWCWATIDQITAVGTGATPKRGDERYWKRGSIPWVTSAVVNSAYVEGASELVTETALHETNLTVYPAGTLLLAMYGEGQTRGRVAELRIASTTNQALAALILVDQSVRLKGWIRLFLERNYDALRRSASGGVQPNLNLGIIRSIRFPLPPLPEQNRIIEEVQSLLSVATRIEEATKANMARGRRTRQSILKWAFEGKLVDQDPNDEPASVLLERIRAERAAQAQPPIRRRMRRGADAPPRAARQKAGRGST